MKDKTIVLIIISILCVSGIIYSTASIVIWKFDNKNIAKEIDNIHDNVVIINIKDNENTQIISSEEESKFNPYWDYIKEDLINVDFTTLKETNPDTVGWLQVGGTNINYPFVYYSDNEYYLKHSFYKSKNGSGWIFLDYRNSLKEYDKNTIIYGHGLKSGAMFGTLNNILKEKWQNNLNNHIVKISTENKNTLWQVFSIYTIPETSDYIKTDFNSDEEYRNFLDRIIQRSVYKFNANLSVNDKILTLSSCYINSENRIVLHAKLIKEENK